MWVSSKFVGNNNIEKEINMCKCRAMFCFVFYKKVEMKVSLKLCGSHVYSIYTLSALSTFQMGFFAIQLSSTFEQSSSNSAVSIGDAFLRSSGTTLSQNMGFSWCIPFETVSDEVMLNSLIPLGYGQTDVTKNNFNKATLWIQQGRWLAKNPTRPSSKSIAQLLC